MEATLMTSSAELVEIRGSLEDYALDARHRGDVDDVQHGADVDVRASLEDCALDMRHRGDIDDAQHGADVEVRARDGIEAVNTELTSKCAPVSKTVR